MQFLSHHLPVYVVPCHPSLNLFTPDDDQQEKSSTSKITLTTLSPLSRRNDAAINSTYPSRPGSSRTMQSPHRRVLTRPQTPARLLMPYVSSLSTQRQSQQTQKRWVVTHLSGAQGGYVYVCLRGDVSNIFFTFFITQSCIYELFVLLCCGLADKQTRRCACELVERQLDRLIDRQKDGWVSEEMDRVTDSYNR